MAKASAADLKKLFDTQQGFLNYFFDQLNYEPLQQFCQAVLDCEGTVFFSGVGKSGFIAQKISMTLVSTGTKSVFLNPTDALHGDIGIVGDKDLLVLFSKSGATEELIKLIPYAKAKGAKLVGVSSNNKSKLAEHCEMHIYLPLERELCPFDLAPVTSTAIQMLFGDTCAVAIMQAKSLTMDEYAMNHPAGRIGKRLILNVKDVMKPVAGLPLCAPDDVLMSVLVELSQKGCGCVLVVDGDMKLLGTFTDGDLRRKLAAQGGGVLQSKMSELMSATPRVTTADTKAVEAMKGMEQPSPVTFLPVVEDRAGMKLAGLVTLHGLVNAGL
mmetsp:Transcript_12792/g.30867  ORF Transcript_12792/g.30867 Transcript_12792/m.30867 type:complete len:327 (-) Transcript_12792:286-1266(-)|eukprot:CAMPEP_0197609736 /NCGR_PEP_ID=MMETSP1326-20131121/51804_1 /TAXON_ID=1155430 /ORGANISM="Genus nov. species nov., Strain RCC2288" /LENGTH=326 /DNA_ID=CAMNT_0043178153 /DNA_START=40 /DNA_END=1020 /DNA_ORIENTATION=+